MDTFEKLYYEYESHWKEGILEDEANMERIRTTAVMVPPDARNLLDAGCGNGVFVNYLLDHRPSLQVLAMDRSRTALNYVKTEKMEGDVTHMEIQDRKYDCVSCLEVIEHLSVPAYETALAELTRVAGKYVIISVPYLEKLEENHNQCPSCKTIFNLDLHMRSFDEDKMDHLLDKYGFTCVKKEFRGLSLHYKGHYTFRKLFYREQFRLWKSPVCILCGYENKPAGAAKMQASVDPAAAPKRKLISYFTGLFKMLWPKEKKYYWVIALYERR